MSVIVSFSLRNRTTFNLRAAALLRSRAQCRAVLRSTSQCSAVLRSTPQCCAMLRGIALLC